MRALWLVIQIYLVLMLGTVSFAAGVWWGASRVAAEISRAAWLRGPAITTRRHPLATRVCGSGDVVDVTHEPRLVVVEEPCPN